MTDPARPSTSPDRRADQEALAWGLFLSLGLIWGSSFLFIKVGLDAGMPPFTLATWRMILASLFLAVMLRVTHGTWPRVGDAGRRLWILAMINVAIPALCIAWGEQSISSALTSVLNGLTPLFTIGIAAIVLRDEPITLNRLAGLCIGFGGAVLLATPNVGDGTATDATTALIAEIAVAAGALCYAIGAVYARHRITGVALVHDPRSGPRQASPIEIALPQAAFSALICGVAAILVEHPPGGVIGLPPDAVAWASVTWLGMLGSGLAYLLFFRLVRAWGATRTTMVTYVIPIVGITLGVVILGERLHPPEILGALLVLGGLVLTNSSVGGRVLFQRRTPTS